MSKKINLSIEARTLSKRLPQKVLRKIKNMSMLELLIQKCKKSKLIDDIIVSTTINPQDDIIAEISKKEAQIIITQTQEALQQWPKLASKYGVLKRNKDYIQKKLHVKI